MKNSVKGKRENFSPTSRNPKIPNNEIFLQNFEKEKFQNLENESDGESPGEEYLLLSGK